MSDAQPNRSSAAAAADRPARGRAPQHDLRHGLLLIDKPRGCTSHDVVVQARRILRLKTIGHCGTLDPEATGLLILTIGRATRLTRFLIRAPKVYEGKVRFGVTTDTYDTAGTVVDEGPTDALTQAKIADAMVGFVGTHEQMPPPYCAKKINGVKYYELARRGEEVPRETKPVEIFAFDMRTPWSPGDDLDFHLHCASGTYARSLAHELGQQLGCGGTLSALRRTSIGNLFDIADSIGIDALRDAIEAGAAANMPGWIPFDDIPLPFSEVTLDPQQVRRIEHGQTVLVRSLEGQEGDWIKLSNRQRHFIAVGAVVERIGTGNVGVVQPKLVFR
ncbi:MAG: tRNA pseudouridine(55) synthase TruB [Acidobacteriota bacterium]